MPVMDGRAFRREQRLDARLRHVPVLVASGSVPNGGLSGLPFLRKPFLVDDLFETASRLTSKVSRGRRTKR